MKPLSSSSLKMRSSITSSGLTLVELWIRAVTSTKTGVSTCTCDLLHSKQAHRVPAENLFFIGVRHAFHLFDHLDSALLPRR